MLAKFRQQAWIGGGLRDGVLEGPDPDRHADGVGSRKGQGSESGQGKQTQDRSWIHHPSGPSANPGSSTASSNPGLANVPD
jgi:hypothetical protein